MSADKFITIPQLAALLGVSRITVYNRVKKGQIAATKVGRSYIINDKIVAQIMGKAVSAAGKKKIDAAIDKTVREYGEVLQQLGNAG